MKVNMSLFLSISLTFNNFLNEQKPHDDVVGVVMEGVAQASKHPFSSFMTIILSVFFFLWQENKRNLQSPSLLKSTF